MHRNKASHSAFFRKVAVTKSFIGPKTRFRVKARLRKAFKNSRRSFRRGYARAYRETEIGRQKVFYWTRQHRKKLNAGLLALAIILGVIAYRTFSGQIEPFFDSPDLLAALRTLFVTLGGALLGATAIGFSVVMLAVQLNFARIPYGLFRRVTSDFRLIGAFVATFAFAGVVTAFSVIPNKSWAALALFVTVSVPLRRILVITSRTTGHHHKQNWRNGFTVRRIRRGARLISCGRSMHLKVPGLLRDIRCELGVTCCATLAETP